MKMPSCARKVTEEVNKFPNTHLLQFKKLKY